MDVIVSERNALVRSWQRARKLDPRYLIAFLITLVLVAAQLRYHMVGGYDRLVLALAVCTATEALLSWFDRGRIVNLLSAYISGISLTLLIKPQGGALWPFALGGFLAISSSTSYAIATTISGIRPTSRSAPCCSPRRTASPCSATSSATTWRPTS